MQLREGAGFVAQDEVTQYTIHCLDVSLSLFFFFFSCTQAASMRGPEMEGIMARLSEGVVLTQYRDHAKRLFLVHRFGMPSVLHGFSVGAVAGGGASIFPCASEGATCLAVGTGCRVQVPSGVRRHVAARSWLCLTATANIGHAATRCGKQREEKHISGRETHLGSTNSFFPSPWV
ncbi:uncharacterized protein LY79DRAFT_535392 [Colletotrichum navitas]|uniref:Uncharacterized protein n=1 Tax=Colletotrichum navitas TaxID=681940 RepID=A0AAD8V9P8_9PEZI|nr:uncharacterized protein LY79DRAFT_535392 [Colletotrichum navitas]KAK1599537.1 hypothetical protein LY79DRAFT_535392 [Colletotrichum navitas]